jgi:hypothetical protein
VAACDDGLDWLVIGTRAMRMDAKKQYQVKFESMWAGR